MSDEVGQALAMARVCVTDVLGDGQQQAVVLGHHRGAAGPVRQQRQLPEELPLVQGLPTDELV
jgi:hypothetical protein